MTAGTRGRDAGVAALLAAGFAVLYRATFQRRMTGDGPVLADTLLAVEDAVHWHALYLPGARVLGRLLAPTPADALEPLRLASVLGGAAGAAGTYLLARGLGARRAPAFLGAALVGVSPFAWFHATTVEVHAPALGAVAAGALATLHAPWRRPVLAAGVAALAYAAAILAHLGAALLGVGWVLLCARGAARRGAPLRGRTLWLGVAPALLAAGLATLAAHGALWTAGSGAGAQAPLDFLRSYAKLGSPAAFAWRDVALPLALLGPAAALGAAVLARTGEGRATLALVAAALGPAWAFLVAWAVPERGGYLVPHASFLGLAAAAGLGALGARSRAAAALVLATQAALAVAVLRAHDDRLDPAERVALLRESLPEGGVVGRVGYLAPGAQRHLDEVVEVDLTAPIRAGFEGGVPPADAAAELAARIDRVLEREPVVLDISHRGVPWTSVEPAFVAYALAYEDALVARYDATRLERDAWVLVALRPRR